MSEASENFHRSHTGGLYQIYNSKYLQDSGQARMTT